MSEEDFACDKFAPQKWRADTCRHCFQPLRLHAKKQAKQGSVGSSSNDSSSDASANSLTDSLGSSPKVTGGSLIVRQVVQKGSTPSALKVKEEQNAGDCKSKSESPATSPAPPSTQTFKSPSPSAAATSNQKATPKSDRYIDPSKSIGISAQPPLAVASNTSTGSKSSGISKPLSVFSSVPSKPPPPAKAAVGKRNSLPRTSPAVAVKPSEVRLAGPGPKAHKSPSPSESEDSSIGSTWENKQKTPEAKDSVTPTVNSIAEQKQEQAAAQPEEKTLDMEEDAQVSPAQSVPLEGSASNDSETAGISNGAPGVLGNEDGEGDNKADSFRNGLAGSTLPPEEKQSSEVASGEDGLNSVGFGPSAEPTEGSEGASDVKVTSEGDAAAAVESATDEILNEDQQVEQSMQQTKNENLTSAADVTKTPALGLTEETAVVDDTIPEQEIPPVNQTEAVGEDVPSTESGPIVSEDFSSPPSGVEQVIQHVDDATSSGVPDENLQSEEMADEPAQSTLPLSLPEERSVPELAEDQVIPPPSDLEVTVEGAESVLPSATASSSEDPAAQEAANTSSLPSKEVQESQVSEQVVRPPSPVAIGDDLSTQPVEDILPPPPPPDDTPLIEDQSVQVTENIIPPPELPADAATSELPASILDTSDVPGIQVEDGISPPPPPLPEPFSPSDEVVVAKSVATPSPPPPLPSPPPDGDLECSAEHIPVPIPPPVSFSGASPPPPPPPPPIQPPTPAWNASLKPKAKPAASDSTQASPQSPPTPHENAASAAHAAAMNLIREGGVSLRKVTQPVERRVGEEKVVDLASEMRQKLRKRNKEEANSVKSEVEGKREEVKKVSEILRGACSTRSYVHQLQALAAKVDEMLQNVGFSEEVLQKYLQWPIHLVAALRRMLELMQQLEQRVASVERLSQQLVSSNRPVLTPEDTPLVGVISSVQMDPDTVDRTITGMLAAAGKVRDVSQLSQSFPVFEHDLERPLHRASQAIQPIMELLYLKAFNTYDSIFHPSISKFDKKFRKQNAIRLLKTCGLLSDGLCTQLNIPKHPDYSQAQLKKQELLTMAVDKDDIEVEETVQLVKSGSTVAKRSGAVSGDGLCQTVLASLEQGEGLSGELKETLTPETFAKMEKGFVKAVLTKGDDKLVEAAIALTREVYAGDEVSCHRSDYDWLYDPVVKGKHERISHLVTACGVGINAQSSDVGNSVLHKAVARKDLATVAVLIRLGADPLLVNGRQHTPVQQLGVKCFPSVSTVANSTEKEPLFSLSSYINSPSLSDVLLISEDGKHFHGHRLVLCAQSPVLKTMVDSDLWAESKNKELPLPTISGRVLELLLNYLYTGRCLFPRDDLNLGLDLLAAADQYLLLELKQLSQQMLSDKIDAEVVVPMYYAAVRYNSAHLLACCSNFLCAHYRDVEDPDHEALLHLLDNAPPQSL